MLIVVTAEAIVLCSLTSQTLLGRGESLACETKFCDCWRMNRFIADRVTVLVLLGTEALCCGQV